MKKIIFFSLFSFSIGLVIGLNFGFSANAIGAEGQSIAALIPQKDSQGKIRGYKVINYKSGSNYEKVGLKTNDIIISINGKSINTPEASAKVYNELNSNKIFNIIYERDGKEDEIAYIPPRR